jgi:hypothetical protein
MCRLALNLVHVVLVEIIFKEASLSQHAHTLALTKLFEEVTMLYHFLLTTLERNTLGANQAQVDSMSSTHACLY